MMIAIPVALIVKRREEQIGPRQLVEDELAVGIDERPSTSDERQITCVGYVGPWSLVLGRKSEDGIAQRATQPVEDGGLEQECLDVLRLPHEHLFGQVVDDEAMTTRERRDKAGVVGAIAHREGRELQPGDPALGARLERG